MADEICRHIGKPTSECTEHNLHCSYPRCVVEKRQEGTATITAPSQAALRSAADAVRRTAAEFNGAIVEARQLGLRVSASLSFCPAAGEPEVVVERVYTLPTEGTEF